MTEGSHHSIERRLPRDKRSKSRRFLTTAASPEKKSEEMKVTKRAVKRESFERWSGLWQAWVTEKG
jgi:hypothetical protein